MPWHRNLRDRPLCQWRTGLTLPCRLCRSETFLSGREGDIGGGGISGIALKAQKPAEIRNS